MAYSGLSPNGLSHRWCWKANDDLMMMRLFLGVATEYGRLNLPAYEAYGEKS